MAYYAIISALVFAVAFAGSWFTSQGITSGWYDSVSKPVWIPPGPVFGFAWTLIFILCAVSIISFWKNRFRLRSWLLVLVLFVSNGVLNIGWTVLFFFLHWVGAAAIDAGALELTILVVVALLWRRERMAAYLLIPYAAWTLFAIYLNANVWMLNR